MRPRRAPPDAPGELTEPAKPRERLPIRTAALLMLGRRDYTVAELRKKLADKEYPAEEIASVVANLVADGSLDDERVAAAHARTASGIKGRGRFRIQRELDARGIERDLARATAGAVPAADEAAAIDRFLDRTRLPARPDAHRRTEERSDVSRTDAAARRRVVQQLLRRGYPMDAIAAALRRRSLPDATDETE
jgi:regulatory protein